MKSHIILSHYRANELWTNGSDNFATKIVPKANRLLENKINIGWEKRHITKYLQLSAKTK